MDQLSQPNLRNILDRGVAQLPKLLPLMLAIYVPILLGIGVLIGMYLVAEIPLRLFFIDPVAEFNSPMYIGLVSNFGVLLWGAAAAVCLFGGWLTLKSKRHQEQAWFLICAGSISAMLMLDDLYLLHEEVIEDHLHISQKFVFAAYGVMVLALLIRFQKIVLSSDFMLLVFAFGFFAISIAVDLFVHPEEFVIFGSLPGRHIIEDGFKLLGIATWAAYLVRTSAQKVLPLIRTA